jgi:hypothetical protein
MKKFFTLCLVALGLAAVLYVNAAANPTIDVNFPGGTNPTTGPQAVGGIIANFYQFALLIGGILAFGAIVYGGVKYTFAAGNPSGQSEGKEWIKGALWGLTLLLGAYLVLKTINPALVNLGLPTLSAVPEITAQPTAQPPPTADSGTCGNLAIIPCPSSDSFCLAMEGGANIVWNSSDPNINQNLVKMHTEVNKMQTLVSSHGGSMQVTSAYRPVSYQMHLYSIYQASLHYNSNMALYNNNPDCGPYVTKLIAEQQHHGICYGNHPCLVASPNGSAPHTMGIGVDIVLSGIAYSSINNLLAGAGINLRWQNAANDPVHFNYTGP